MKASRRKNAVLGVVVLSALAAAACSTTKTATPPTPTPSSPASSPSAAAPTPTPAPSASPGTSPSPAASLLPVPAGSLAMSITFISLNDAWVLAKAGSTAAVLETTDRGAHWGEVGTIPAGVGSAAGGVSKIRFANAQDGWAFDPGLYATTNGGATWHAVSSLSAGQVGDVEASGNAAWAAAYPCPPGTGCASDIGSLYEVAAGSDAWQKVTGVSLPAQSTVIAPQGQTVYVESGTTLLRTTNASTFSSFASPCPSGYVPSSLTAGSATDVEVLCAGSGAAGSVGKDVFVSTNSGASFHQVPAAPLGGDPQGIAAGSSTTIAVAAASGASWIYLTTGADATWTTPLSFSDGGAGWADLGFTDATHGVVIHGPGISGMGTVYLTNDGGATWTQSPLT